MLSLQFNIQMDLYSYQYLFYWIVFYKDISKLVKVWSSYIKLINFKACLVYKDKDIDYKRFVFKLILAEQQLLKFLF